MTTRSRSETVVFQRPFQLSGMDRLLPAGTYRVVTDAELIEALSFPVYRRTATMMFVPGPGGREEMITIDPDDLAAAQLRDAAAALPPGTAS